MFHQLPDILVHTQPHQPYEKVFSLNILLSSATVCALKRKMKLHEDNFLLSVPGKKCMQSAALQPSEKAKELELLGMPDEEGTSKPDHCISCNKPLTKRGLEISGTERIDVKKEFLLL